METIIAIILLVLFSIFYMALLGYILVDMFRRVKQMEIYPMQYTTYKYRKYKQKRGDK